MNITSTTEHRSGSRALPGESTLHMKGTVGEFASLAQVIDLLPTDQHSEVYDTLFAAVKSAGQS